MKASEQSTSPQSNFSLDARVQAWTSYCLSMGRPLLLMLGFMTLHRFLAWWMTASAFTFVENDDLVRAFLTGARFDLLVIGFFLIPVVLIGSAVTLGGFWPERFFSLFLRFLAGAWLFTCGLATLDLLFFAVNNRRLTLIELERGTQFFGQALRGQGPQTIILVVLIMICTWLIGSREIFSSRVHKILQSPSRPSRVFIVGKILAPIVFVALMARGTVTAHHLERQQSLISKLSVLNELALNAVWCFDKEPQNR